MSIHNTWISTEEKKPPAYETVFLVERIGGKEVPGWWNGSSWEGPKVKAHVRYRFWKHNLTHYL